MPATDRDSTRGVPIALLIAAAVVVVARVVVAVTMPETPAAPRDLGIHVGAREAIRWRQPGAGEAEAARTGRPVLYDFTAEWCEPCRQMKNDVFRDSSLARRLEMVAVPVQVLDRQREDGRNSPAVDSLQAQFGVDGFPTLVVYEPRTGKFERLDGYPGAAQTRSWMLEKPAAVASSPAPPPLPVPGGR